MMTTWRLSDTESIYFGLNSVHTLDSFPLLIYAAICAALPGLCFREDRTGAAPLTFMVQDGWDWFRAIVICQKSQQPSEKCFWPHSMINLSSQQRRKLDGPIFLLEEASC